MSVSRAAISAYLANELHTLAIRLGQEELDSPEGYQYALDSTWSRLGYPGTMQAVLLEDTQTEAARALARYYALSRILRNKPAVTPEGGDLAAFGNIERLVELASIDAKNEGFPVDRTNSFQMGEIEIDWNTTRGIWDEDEYRRTW
jgi:hypothetical protein